MKKTLKIIALISLLISIISTSVFAQSSNTFTATAGTMRTDVDNFMDVRYFNEVDFENLFSSVDFSLNEFNLGFATNINKLYLGAYYSGDLFNSFEKSENFGVDGKLNNFGKTTEFNHEFDVLFGFSGMGIKLTSIFAGTEDYLTNHTKTEITKNLKTNIALTWGGLYVPIRDGYWRPYLSLGFLNLNNSKNTTTLVSDVSLTESYEKIGGYSNFMYNISSDFEFGSKYDFFSVFGFSYIGLIDVAINGDVSSEIISFKDGDQSKTVVTRKDASSVWQIFSPYYRFEYQFSDSLRLGGSANIFLQSNIIDEGKKITSVDGTTSEPVESGKSKETKFASNLSLGLNYFVKSNFAINFGYKADFPIILGKTQENTDDSKVKGSSTISEFINTLSMGFAWYISENCIFDTSLDISTIPKFFTDILDSSMSIGFILKK